MDNDIERDPLEEQFNALPPETQITLRFRLFAGNGKILERTFESREAADRFEARNAIVVIERIES